MTPLASANIESSNGTITLRGTVSSWADHDEAVAAAWPHRASHA